MRNGNWYTITKTDGTVITGTLTMFENVSRQINLKQGHKVTGVWLTEIESINPVPTFADHVQQQNPI